LFQKGKFIEKEKKIKEKGTSAFLNCAVFQHKRRGCTFLFDFFPAKRD